MSWELIKARLKALGLGLLALFGVGGVLGLAVAIARRIGRSEGAATVEAHDREIEQDVTRQLAESDPRADAEAKGRADAVEHPTADQVRDALAETKRRSGG